MSLNTERFPTECLIREIAAYDMAIADEVRDLANAPHANCIASAFLWEDTGRWAREARRHENFLAQERENMERLRMTRDEAMAQSGNTFTLRSGETATLGALQVEGCMFAVYDTDLGHHAYIDHRGYVSLADSETADWFAVEAGEVVPDEPMTDEEMLAIITAHRASESIQCKRLVGGGNWAPATHLGVANPDFAQFRYRIDPSSSREWWKVANEISLTRRGGTVNIKLPPVAARALLALLPSGTTELTSPAIMMHRLRTMVNGAVLNGPLTDINTPQDMVEGQLSQRLTHQDQIAQ